MSCLSSAASILTRTPGTTRTLPECYREASTKSNRASFCCHAAATPQRKGTVRRDARRHLTERENRAEPAETPGKVAQGRVPPRLLPKRLQRVQIPSPAPLPFHRKGSVLIGILG